MGSYLFSWSHPATEVYVTGTFDNWNKTNKLEKKGEVFEKLINLDKVDQEIYYKFFVDGEWKLDHTVPQKEDGHNNLNNVLTPDHIKKHPVTMSSAAPGSTTAALAGAVPLEKEGKKSALETAAISSAAPESSTAALAGAVPLEKKAEKTGPASGTAAIGAATISSAAPDSSTAALAKDVPLQDKTTADMPGNFPETPAKEPATYSVNPIPASAGAGNPVKLAPGEKVPDPSTLTSHTVSSTVKDDQQLLKQDQDPKAFGVDPLPATAGAGNPIKLKPGEKVPHPSTYSSHTVASTITTDKESYEKGPSHAGAGSTAAPVVAGGAFGILPVTGSTKEGSKENQSATISSTAPTSTTAGLAGAVPLEKKETPATAVPDVVKESQSEAKVAPEASANAEAVKEKAAVESELKKDVSPTPAVSDKPSGGKVAGAAAAGVTAATGAVAATAYAAKDKVTGSSSHTDGVPKTVEKSIEAAHKSPEAAANKEAVAEKKAVESELLKEVKPVTSSGEPAPTATAATTEKAPQPTKPRIDSRDVSPLSRPHGETSTAPPKTEAASTPAKDTVQGSSTPSTTATSTDKKKNRRSFFGKIKDKLKHSEK